MVRTMYISNLAGVLGNHIIVIVEIGMMCVDDVINKG
jgi:hypothetical protein